MKPTTDEMLAFVRSWAAAQHPGRLPLRVRIDFHDGEQMRLLVPTAAVPVVASSPAEPSDIRDQILELLSGEAAPLKAVTIATRLSRAYSGSFRATLKGMREAQEIVQDANGRYALAE